MKLAEAMNSNMVEIRNVGSTLNVIRRQTRMVPNTLNITLTGTSQVPSSFLELA